MLLRVVQRGGGMGKPVQPMGKPRLVPVVEKEIVQQRAADKAAQIEAQAQAAAEPEAAIGDRQAVLQAGNPPVLHIAVHRLHQLVRKDFPGAAEENPALLFR